MILFHIIEQSVKHSHNRLFASSCINCPGLKTNITYKPRCRITRIQRGQIVQGEGANEPGREQARKRTSQGANRHRGEKARHQLTILG